MDPIRRAAASRAKKEARAQRVHIAARIPRVLMERCKELLPGDRISLAGLIELCIGAYALRDPGVLALIEQWHRDRAKPKKVVPQNPSRDGMFSGGELAEIWKEIGEDEDG